MFKHDPTTQGDNTGDLLVTQNDTRKMMTRRIENNRMRKDLQHDIQSRMKNDDAQNCEVNIKRILANQRYANTAKRRLRKKDTCWMLSRHKVKMQVEYG